MVRLAFRGFFNHSAAEPYLSHGSRSAETHDDLHSLREWSVLGFAPTVDCRSTKARSSNPLSDTMQGSMLDWMVWGPLACVLAC